MRFEALDITIESRGTAVWVFLSGPFHHEQVPNIREKVAQLIDDGNRRLVVVLEQVTEIDDSAPPMFLELLNLVRGKRGELRLVFRNRVVSDAFLSYRNIFPIYPDESALKREPLDQLRSVGRLLSRKTGVRLSLPVALVMLVFVVGWFVTLAWVASTQRKQIEVQEKEIHELSLWKQQTLIELNDMRERLRPMEQLGILKDKPKRSSGK